MSKAAAVRSWRESLQSLGAVLDFARQVVPTGGVESSGPTAMARVVPAPLPHEAEVRQQVLAQQLSATITRWFNDYREFGPRDLYLWRWCAMGVRLTMLPAVEDSLREDVCDTKVLSIMLNVLVDDVADRRERSALLPALLAVVRGSEPNLRELAEEERAHVAFTARVRREYWERVNRYPCAGVFRELLAYDLDQLFNAIHYSALLNQQLGLLNVVEHDLYSPHNMMMMSFATLDLMCAPDFHVEELGKLREAIWHAQWMGRIGNLLSTWEREIAMGDYTSGVFAQAISRGDLTVEDLQSGDRQQIAGIIERGGYQAEYGRRWRYHRDCFHRRAAEIHSVDMQPLLGGHDQFYRMHVGSKGLI